MQELVLRKGIALKAVLSRSEEEKNNDNDGDN